MNMIRAALVGLGLVCASSAAAQVSLDDLDKAMDSRSDQMAAFRDRLNDPDPDRAMTAMQLLITKGDTQQKQMAIDHGLSSTNPAIRMAAVTAVFDSQPILVSRWYPEERDFNNNFRNRVKHFRGTINADKSARVPLAVGQYSEDAKCWVDLQESRYCLFRINSGEISIRMDGWAQVALDDSGRLMGTPMIGGYRTEVVIDLGR